MAQTIDHWQTKMLWNHRLNQNSVELCVSLLRARHYRCRAKAPSRGPRWTFRVLFASEIGTSAASSLEAKSDPELQQGVSSCVSAPLSVSLHCRAPNCILLAAFFSVESSRPFLFIWVFFSKKSRDAASSETPCRANHHPNQHQAANRRLPSS